MGRFETISVERLKSYTLYSKGSLSKVLSLSKRFPIYNFFDEEKDDSVEVYLDSPNNLLVSAGIILCKVVEKSKAYFRVEKEDWPDRRSTLTKGKRVFIHDICARDTVFDHSLFLVNGITSMFSSKFNIDLENVLRTVVPKIEIKSRKRLFKVLSGKGFKANMEYGVVKIKNYTTKRKANFLMLDIEHIAPQTKIDEFNNFILKLEKHCKEIIPTNDSKYEIAKRMTAAIK